MNHRPWLAPLETEDEDFSYGEGEIDSAPDFEALNLRRAATENTEALRLARAI